MKHFIINVSGNVQGVNFRASAKEIAQRLSITGFAQNQPDGSVCIEAEGSEESLTQFVAWCKLGSPRAEVDAIHVMEGELKNFSKFEIKR